MSNSVSTQDDFTRLVELTPELRRKIETAVERLLDILDVYDGDENAEDDGTSEPVNGWPNEGQRPVNAMSCDDDREVDNADYEEGGDREPTLGWSSTPLQDREYCPEELIAADNECEADVADEQHDEADEGNNEPWLGWVAGGDQTNVHRFGDRAMTDGEIDTTVPDGRGLQFERGYVVPVHRLVRPVAKRGVVKCYASKATHGGFGRER
ncbi:hypothetical protein FF124_10765 [Martelella lutilitoris]|uniref:Uncharacterized protein n=1 Tax=Martelella lutilitoris TaxID=2583532 RepID=A0A5C4JSB1_9HYPH|nr:hypothetical protein [Martelella lutilitoris]TNB48054.1 hypothetical protein FF124_10765 [Martelella lutilitoris]